MSKLCFKIGRLLLLQLFVLGLFNPMSVLHAKDKVSPMTLAGAKTITANDIIDLIDKLPQLMIIDSRMNDRPQGYIETSVNLADIDTTCDSLAGILKQLHTPVIFYCNGPKCRRSEKAINIAVSCGYDQIYWYRGGFDDWMKQGYPYIAN